MISSWLAGRGARWPLLISWIGLVALTLIGPIIDGGFARFPYWLAVAVLLVWSVGAFVRRMHAMGRTGLWVLPSAIPFVGIGLWIWALVSRRDQAPARVATSRHLVGGFLLIVIGLLAASRALWEPYWIPSSSMKPTLLVGDYIVAVRMVREARRGDVIVFRHPVTEQDFIARLIGLPGDRIQMDVGRLVINGEPVPQEPAGQFVETYERQGPLGNLPLCTGLAVGIGADCVKDRYLETLPNGETHFVLDITERRSDQTSVFTVPPGQYFFMGDNRDNSTDSRVAPGAGGVGFVPYENLIGRADRVMFSSAGRSLLFFWTWRGDRFFEKIE